MQVQKIKFGEKKEKKITLQGLTKSESCREQEKVDTSSCKIKKWVGLWVGQMVGLEVVQWVRLGTGMWVGLGVWQWWTELRHLELPGRTGQKGLLCRPGDRNSPSLPELGTT